jgi:hypothetical protein
VVYVVVIPSPALKHVGPPILDPANLLLGAIGDLLLHLRAYPGDIWAEDVVEHIGPLR